MQQTISFTIDEGGQVTIETSGFKGPACEAATKAFREALGGTVISDIKKPEFYQFTQQTAKQGN